MPGSMTKGLFSSLFLGSELVVAGKLNGSDIDSKVEGTTVNGTASFQAKVSYALMRHISISCQN